MSAPSTPVTFWMIFGSRGAREISWNPRHSVKNGTVRSRLETVKLV